MTDIDATSSPHGEYRTVPTPALEYHLDGWQRGAVVLPDQPRIYRVRRVSAFMGRDDEPYVYVCGPMLCRDGGPGPNRSGRVDIEADQPTWLVEVIEDITRRLSDMPVTGRTDA